MTDLGSSSTWEVRRLKAKISEMVNGKMDSKIQRGSSGAWEWMKFDNGFAIATGNFQFKANPASWNNPSWGYTVYELGSVELPPLQFMQPVHVSASVIDSMGFLYFPTCTYGVYENRYGKQVDYASISVLSYTNRTDDYINARFVVVGVTR